MKDKPILIIGSARSGTTWVGRTISQSRHIRYIHEPFNRDCPNKEFGLKIPFWLYDAEFGELRGDIERVFSNLLNINFLQCGNRDSQEFPNWKTPLGFIKNIGSSLRSPENILVKDPLAVVAAGWLHETFGFRVICMIRNPLSFVASMKRAGWGFDANELTKQHGLVGRRLSALENQIYAACETPGEIVEQNCLLWNVVHTLLLDYKERYPSWLYLKQEELALNPVRGFKKIFDELDLEFTTDIEEYVITHTSADAAGIPLSTNYQERNARSTVDLWKSILSSDEAALVVEKTKELYDLFYPTVPDFMPHYTT